MENIFKSQLSALRQKKHFSQELLAQKLFVSRQSISKWENGESEPNIDKLIAISEILSVNLDFLLAGYTHSDSVILELKNLNKSFKNPVLKDVNLSIYGRDRIALLGSNGSGKTTIVNTILGNIIPDKGSVIKHFNAQDDLSVMTQENCLITSLKVREQIALSLKIYNAYSTIKIDAMLKKFRLFEQSEVIIEQLSGGQKRRLNLLLALIKPSKLLILDEPTVGMDLESIDLFWDYLDHVGGSVVTITHDFNQIDNYFTRVLLLKNGVIKSDESVANIHSNNQTIEHWYRLMNQ